MSRPAPLPAAIVAAASEVLRRRTGLVASESRQAALEAGIARTMLCAGRMDPEEFPARLANEAPLLQALIAEVAVGETYFFRDSAQLALIRDEILPGFVGCEGGLRIWSAGCATGEEPFSLAIQLAQLGRLGGARILGTDLARPALAAARRARDGQWSFRGVPPDVVEAYFQRIQGKWEPEPAVREAVEFRYLNLAEDIYPSPASGIGEMDLILCRNVLIYFDADTAARVARRLIDSLSDRGWLLLGAADPPIARLAQCEVLTTPAGLAYRRVRPGGGPVAPRFAKPRPRPMEPAHPVAPIPVPPTVQEPPAVIADTEPEALVRYAARDYEGAVLCLERWLRGSPDDAALWILLVRAHANRGALAEAGRACAMALDRHPLVAELVYLHALLLSEARLYAEAAAAARRALYLDPTLAVVHLLLGSALLRLGDVAGAECAFTNAERRLAALPESAIVPASDGEPASRLATLARAQAQLARSAIA